MSALEYKYSAVKLFILLQGLGEFCVFPDGKALDTWRSGLELVNARVLEDAIDRMKPWWRSD